jgi:hypothetical protein
VYMAVFWKSRCSVFIALYHASFSLATKNRMFQHSLDYIVSHKHVRDQAKQHESCSFARLPHELWRPQNMDFFLGVKRPERRADH